MQKTNIDEYNTQIYNYTYSSLLARIGIYNKIEIRLGSDYLNMTANFNRILTSNNGFNNILVGGKYQLISEDNCGQALGLLSYSFTFLSA